MTDLAINLETQSRTPLNPIAEVEGRIAWVKLSRPDRANALDSKTLELVLDAIDKAEDQQGVEALVLHGAGQHFCAGADLQELHSNGPEGIRHLLDRFREVTRRIERSHLVVIAAVHGAARAGGIEISLACDLVLAGSSATFGDAHLSKGLLPGGGSTARLPRAIGWQRSKWMILSAQSIDAETAKDWGLVFEVFDDRDLLQAAEQQALSMTRGDTETIRRAKSLISSIGDISFSESLEAEIATLEKHYDSESFQRGVGAFLSRGKSK
ncbi:enoyl-CoA hydratase/isomerase family protein [Neorhizobium sp. DT-125]|uniref:enoyl-CoA hydratase/isomerase family protein n=1 Tax=Neorhizobium sp. DT-125 TaxID=3396163 RepID=UPI003F1A3D98